MKFSEHSNISIAFVPCKFQVFGLSQCYLAQSQKKEKNAQKIILENKKFLAHLEPP